MLNFFAQWATIGGFVIVTLQFFGLTPKIWFWKNAGEMSTPVRRSKTVLIMIVLTWIWCGVTSYQNYQNSKVIRFDPNVKLEVVSGHTFRDEEVSVDGKNYVGCVFENVKFRYDGKAPFGFYGNKFIGARGLHTENPSISHAIAFQKGLGLIQGSIPVYGPDGKPITGVEPPGHVIR